MRDTVLSIFMSGFHGRTPPGSGPPCAPGLLSGDTVHLLMPGLAAARAPGLCQGGCGTSSALGPAQRTHTAPLAQGGSTRGKAG